MSDEERESIDAGDQRRAGLRDAFSQTITWLSIAIGGLLAFDAGVVIEVHRRAGDSSGSELSFSDPGVAVALIGLCVACAGVLAALTLLAFQSAGSPEVVVRRGIGVAAVWAIVVSSGIGAVTYIATTGVTIGGEVSSSGGARVAASAVRNAAQRVVVSGRLTLDGAPFSAEFLGADVTDAGGLVSSCQLDVVAVGNGRYTIEVVGEAEVIGCGNAGGRLVLWTNNAARSFYSAETLAWPPQSGEVTFDTSFSTATPDGARRPGTEFFGKVTDGAGTTRPAGTLVEAFAGDVRCGRASVRESLYYSLTVVGPDSVAGCARGAALTFRVDGRPAAETATNNLAFGQGAGELHLTVR